MMKSSFFEWYILIISSKFIGKPMFLASQNRPVDDFGVDS